MYVRCFIFEQHNVPTLKRNGHNRVIFKGQFKILRDDEHYTIRQEVQQEEDCD